MKLGIHIISRGPLSHANTRPPIFCLFSKIDTTPWLSPLLHENKKEYKPITLFLKRKENINIIWNNEIFIWIIWNEQNVSESFFLTLAMLQEWHLARRFYLLKYLFRYIKRRSRRPYIFVTFFGVLIANGGFINAVDGKVLTMHFTRNNNKWPCIF